MQILYTKNKTKKFCKDTSKFHNLNNWKLHNLIVNNHFWKHHLSNRYQSKWSSRNEKKSLPLFTFK